MNRFTVCDEFGGLLRRFSTKKDAITFMRNKRGCTVREIAELRAEIKCEEQRFCDAYDLIYKQSKEKQELQAHIHVLREALEEAAIFVDNHSEDWYKSGQALLTKCKQALASTPALKGNEFPNSANLDVYNSVIFSDGSHGTMIMESKIVKWLCRNRAKDYFDEMVEGK